MVAGVVGVFAAVVIPSAHAQNYAGYPPSWTPDAYYVDESAGEVVLTLHFPIPGRIMYRTVDREAQAPEDYTAVSGEVVFTSDSSRTIRIPIVADDLDEPGYSESFIVEAWEEQPPETCSGHPCLRDPGGASATVFIVDDDEVGETGQEPAEAAATATTAAGGPTSDSPLGPPPPTTVGAAVVDLGTPASTSVSPSPEVEVELASENLRPGPGFELPNDDPLDGALDGRGGSEGLSSGLAFGLGTAAMSVGAVAWVRRRRRWSPTRA